MLERRTRARCRRVQLSCDWRGLRVKSDVASIHERGPESLAPLFAVSWRALVGAVV
jgi:hypothetical protein